MNTIKLTFTIFFLLLISIKSVLSAHQRDILYINGEKFYINNRFLLKDKIQNYISENNYDDNYTVYHSNYYTAEFELNENHLYLKEITIYPTWKDQENLKLSECDQRTMNDFKNIKLNTVLVVSKTQSDLITIDSEKTAFIIIEIKKNAVTKIYNLENAQKFLKFRCDQFLRYKLMNKYKDDYYYSLKAIESSRDRFNYEEENLPIEEEVNNFIEKLFLESENYKNIL